MQPVSRNIFLPVMGAPYESELMTTVFRLVDAALDAGHKVAVWTCGAATTLTLGTLDEAKPRNLLDLGTALENTVYPTTARLVRALLERGGDRLSWNVCRHCLQERVGEVDHMDGVKIQPPFNFVRLLERADVCLLMGVK